MARYLTRIRRDFGAGRKVAFFADNAKINDCGLVKQAAADEDPELAECRLLFNQPYRPDLVCALFILFSFISFMTQLITGYQ